MTALIVIAGCLVGAITAVTAYALGWLAAQGDALRRYRNHLPPFDHCRVSAHSGDTVMVPDVLVKKEDV